MGLKLPNNENSEDINKESIIEKEYQELDKKSLDSGEDEKIDKEEGETSDNESVFDDTITDITKSDKLDKNMINMVENLNINVDFEPVLNNTLDDSSIEVDKEDFETLKHRLKLVKELELFHQNKIKEIEEKIKEYNDNYQKLEEKIQETNKYNESLIEKRMEYGDTLKDFEEKTKQLEESRREFSEKTEELDGSKREFANRSTKLQEAREQFMELSKKLEEKKITLNTRENDLEKMQRVLENKKFEIEKNKIEFDRAKLEYEIEKSDFESKSSKLGFEDYEEELKDDEENEIIVEKKKEIKGKAEILEDLLQQLMDEGGFNSCYLIDGKGMLISERSTTKFDTIAIGAMFSLMSTNLLRTINSLNLLELKHSKFSSTNGEFILKNISILNYERDFILLAYCDESNLSIPKLEQTLDRKTLKRIIKSVEKDFYSYGGGQKISWILDSLVEKVSFLKQKSQMLKRDVEAIRLDALNTTSNKIKLLFEI
jgi:predicted regulator of Ras-like GTPase activity (Roadblock/LC7/MglB family)